MAELVVSLKGRVLQRVPITRQHMTVGREPSNDVVIDNDSVSRVHAVVAYEGSRFIARDNNSANGLFANGAQVTAHVFVPGSGVQLGKFTLEVDEDAGPSVDVIESHDISEDKTGQFVPPSPLRTTHLTVDELERALRAASVAAGGSSEGPRWPTGIAAGAPEPAPRTVGSFQKGEPGRAARSVTGARDDGDSLKWMFVALSAVVVVLLGVVFWLVSKV